jgi:hypothetical protein
MFTPHVFKIPYHLFARKYLLQQLTTPPEEIINQTRPKLAPLKINQSMLWRVMANIRSVDSGGYLCVFQSTRT